MLRYRRVGNWRLYRWLTASFGHVIALRSRVVRANWMANRDALAAAFHPSLHEAERERRARETIVPSHTRRFRWRGCPSLVRFFSLPVPHSSLRTLAANCPPSSHTAASAHHPLAASWWRIVMDPDRVWFRGMGQLWWVLGVEVPWGRARLGALGR